MLVLTRPIRLHPAAMTALLCCLLTLFATVQAELTNANFAKCPQFFYKGTPPTGFQSTYAPDLKYICQKYENQYRFATMYHTTNRAPIYSAYVMNPKGKNRPQGPDFKMEPQLVDKRLNAEMKSEADIQAEMSSLGILPLMLADSQALNADYDGSGYVKGHLNPVADQKFIPSKCATCTLTNAAPMDPTFNNGGWKSYEIYVRRKAKELKCAKMYVLRGVIPGNNWIKTNWVDRVNIPGQAWGAYCCVDKKGKPIESKGGIGVNIKGAKVKQMAVATLQRKLPRTIQLFDRC